MSQQYAEDATLFEQGPGMEQLLELNSRLTTSSDEHPLDDAPYITRAQEGQSQQTLIGESDPSDGSEALFSMYLDKAIEEDNKMAESWKGEADGLLIFVSLQTTSHTSAHDV